MNRLLTVIILFVIPLGVGFYYYTNYYKTNIQTKEENLGGNPEIVTKEVNGVFYFVDKTNKISFYIDTKKEILNENRNPNNTAKEEASVKFTFNTDPTSKIIYQVEYFPKQWFGQEGAHFYSFTLYNENFEPSVFWKDYISNDFFKYEEINIGNFKVYQTETEPGISRNYSSYFVINPNKYLHVFYYPNFEEKLGKDQYDQLIQTISDQTDIDKLIK